MARQLGANSGPWPNCLRSACGLTSSPTSGSHPWSGGVATSGNWLAGGPGQVKSWRLGSGTRRPVFSSRSGGRPSPGAASGTPPSLRSLPRFSSLWPVCPFRIGHLRAPWASVIGPRERRGSFQLDGASFVSLFLCAACSRAGRSSASSFSKFASARALLVVCSLSPTTAPCRTLQPSRTTAPCRAPHIT